MNQIYTEKDWKLFRSKIGRWQETYMDRLNQEYIALLSGDAAPSEKFWALEKRLRADKRHVGVQVDMRRSMLFENLCMLLLGDVITLDDISGFSENLQDALKFVLRNHLRDIEMGDDFAEDQ